MASTNAELRTEVAAFLQRDDLTAIIPTFITMATQRFSDELRTPEMEAVVSTTITSEWTQLPSDFRAMRVLEGDGNVLEYRTPWQIQRLVQTDATPDYPVYTIQDMQFRIYPFQSSLPVELTYYAALTPLVNGGDTNWLLQKRPDVYLHGALVHAWLYVQDREAATFSQAVVDKYMTEANRAARQISYGSSPLAVRVA